MKVNDVMKLLTFVVLFAATTLLSHPVLAATGANQNSPLGINLNALTYYDPEEPFLNIFKTTAINHDNPSAWATLDGNWDQTHEQQYLQLDSDGYPTGLTATAADPNSPQKFSQVCAILMVLPKSNGGTGLPYEPGQYVILYDGVGTIQVGLDATMVSTSQGPTGGRDVFDVASPSGGVWLCITKTDPSNHIHNIRVVKAENESLLDAGNIYTPAFLNLMKNFRVIRAMQWLKMDEDPGPAGVWANRSQVGDAGWGSNNGVPMEAVIDLCNAVSSDCWINIPYNADDSYITQLATLVHQQLGPTQKVYVEFSNEVWNTIYPQYQYAAQQGQALWPSLTNSYDANRNWYGMRVAQTCDIWAQVWGSDFSRVHCVLGAQSGNPRSATEALDCTAWSGAPCAKHHITDVAVAPYFGYSSASVPGAWTTLNLAAFVNDTFTEYVNGGLFANGDGTMAGILQEMSDEEASFQKAIAAYNLPMIAYEGGQSLKGFPNYFDGSAVVNGMIAANRDPRMASVYTAALNDWKANGGRTYVLYDDVDAPSEYGEWGLLESFMDTTTPLSSAPPKWQAVQQFIANDPCWWPNCTGTIAEVPRAPSGFKASK